MIGRARLLPSRKPRSAPLNRHDPLPHHSVLNRVHPRFKTHTPTRARARCPTNIAPDFVSFVSFVV